MDSSMRTSRLKALAAFQDSRRKPNGRSLDASTVTLARVGAGVAAELGCCVPPLDERAYYTVTGNRANGAFDLSGDFTIEWIQTMTEDGVAAPRVFSIGNYGSTPLFAVSLEGGGLFVFINDRTFPEPISGDPPVFQVFNYNTYGSILNKSVHFAIRRSGTTVEVYLDGSSLGAFTYGNDITMGSATFTIRNQSTPGGSTQFYGGLSSFRWSNAALYTIHPDLTFTPPTAPLTAAPSTVLLINKFPTSGSTTASGFTVTRYEAPV